MIYLLTHGGGCLIILDDGNFERLKQHRPGTTPDGKVQIVYQPDLLWLGEQLELHYKDGALDGKVIASILEIGKSRPPRPMPEGFETKNIVPRANKEKPN